MKYILCAIVLLVSGYAISAPPIFVDSPEDAFILAEEVKHPVLLVFGADWCKFCNIMKSDINADLSIVENYIVCYIDYDKRSDMVKEYKVKTIPDSIIYKNKIEIKRKVGYKDKNDLKNWLQK